MKARNDNIKLVLFALILTLSACDQNARTQQQLQEQRTCPQTNKILSDEEVINAAISMLLDSNKFEVERDIINLEGMIDYVDVADFLTQNPKCCRFSNDEFVEDYLNNGFLSTYPRLNDKNQDRLLYPVFISYRFSQGQAYDYRSGYIFVGTCGKHRHNGGLRDEGATKDFYDPSAGATSPMAGANDAPSGYLSNQSALPANYDDLEN